MKRVRIFRFVAFGILVLAVFVTHSVWTQTSSKRATGGQDVVINFSASQVTENVWFGTAGGDVSGEVTLEALGNPPQIFRGTWAGRTRWQIVAGNDSFIADMNGKINTYNGVLIMRGRAIDGANAGARITAQGQVIAVNPHQFAGTIRVHQP